jgi:hypothetical protein
LAALMEATMREPEREILVDEAGREWVIEWVSPVFGPPVTDDDAGPATAVCARRFNRRAGDSDLTQVRTKPLVLFAYDEQEAAEAAAQQVAAALERAVLVQPLSQ